MATVTESSERNGEEPSTRWVEVVASQVDRLRFGVVQIVVHDSRVVQIERTEKVRLAPSSSSARIVGRGGR